MQALWMILTGVLAGISAGVFGIGGGIILIPVLLLVFKYPQATANGTSLVALLLPVGILGVLEYYKAGKITGENIKWGLFIAVGMFLGTYLGARLAVFLPVRVLGKLFAGFLLLVSVRLFLTR